MTGARSTGAEGAGADLRARILRVARAWIGTPYRHQAACQGAGADCLGLVRGVWREVYGAEPEQPPAYTPDWAETSSDEPLLRAALRHLVPVAPDEATVGDILVFRMRARGPAKHVAILATEGLRPGRIIHAYSGHSVCETSLGDAWLRRLAGQFRMPQIRPPLTSSPERRD